MANTITGISSAALVEEYLNKKLLERRDYETALLNETYGRVDGIPMESGQYSKFTRKQRLRRPQTMATPGGAGSDPSSGAQLGVDQITVPVEFLQEYIDVPTTLTMTSWLRIKEWIDEDMPLALKRRKHELVQNAMLVGRMTPGVWSSTSTVATTAFDQSAEATVTLYSTSFTFYAAPHYYANGKASFADLDETDTLKWSDIRSAYVKLELAGARKINGSYVCVLSISAWNDLMRDTDNGLITSAIAGGMQTAIKGLENYTTYKYAGFVFVIDDSPFTEDFGGENKRANYGKIHSCLCFGAKSFTWMPMNGKGLFSKPRTKTQDITKTGYSMSVGYLQPYQIAMVNPDWALVIKAPVTEYLPNNYDPADPTKQLNNFGNMV